MIVLNVMRNQSATIAQPQTQPPLNYGGIAAPKHSATTATPLYRRGCRLRFGRSPQRRPLR
jgi:hypothetical protein